MDAANAIYQTNVIISSIGAGEVMACNLLLENTAEGIDAFLQKRPAIWRGK